MLYKVSCFADYTAFFMLHILQKILGTANVVFLAVICLRKTTQKCLKYEIQAEKMFFIRYRGQKNNFSERGKGRYGDLCKRIRKNVE